MTDLEKRAEEYLNNKYGKHKVYLIKNIESVMAEFAKQETELLSKHILELQADKGRLIDENAEAKEIIRELLSSCFGYNSKTVNYEVKAKAEAFLKEAENA